MNLLVTGCSHSAGSEILEKWGGRCPERAYGSYIAKTFGFDQYINIAQPGCSNQYIYFTAIEYLKKIKNPQDWFVIIGWTNSMRATQYCYERNEIVHLCPNQTKLDRFSSATQKAYEHIYRTMLPLNLSTQMDNCKIIGMQSLLKQLGISYVFFDAVRSNHEFSGDRFIDKKHYYLFNDSENGYWRRWQEKYWDNDERWENHAPEWYHSLWANELSKFIIDNKLATVNREE